jgi:hypothetical protein
LTIKKQYSANILFAREAMEIHQMLTFWSNLLLLMLIRLMDLWIYQNVFELWTNNAYKYCHKYLSQCIRSNSKKLNICPSLFYGQNSELHLEKRQCFFWIAMWHPFNFLGKWCCHCNPY